MDRALQDAERKPAKKKTGQPGSKIGTEFVCHAWKIFHQFARYRALGGAARSRFYYYQPMPLPYDISGINQVAYDNSIDAAV